MNLERIPIALLLAVSMAAALGGGIIKNHFSIKLSGSAVERHLFNGVTSLTSAGILLLWGGVASVSAFTLVLGIGFGIVTALQQISSLKAMEKGSWAYTSVIISLSTLITALSGSLFWSERMTWAQIVGIILMVGCLVLSVSYKEDQKKASLQWLVYCLLAFVCTGLIGVMQKWHQSSDARAELNAFLVVAFTISFAYSAVSWGVLHNKNSAKNGSCGRWQIIALLAGGGACIAVNNKLNLFLSGVMESAVFFPVVNGGGLVLTTLFAVLLFRERLTLRQWIGLSFGIVSVVFLCNPF